MDELQAGIFDLGGGTLYDADDDIFITNALHGGDIGGVYKNPLDKARDEEKKAEKNKNWLITKGPEEMAKLLKERETLDNIIGRLNDELVENGQTYRDNYEFAREALANYQPAIKAAQKMKLEPMIKKSVGESVGNIYTQRITDNPGAQYKHVMNPFNAVPRIEGPRRNLIEPPRRNLIENKPSTKIVTDPQTGLQMVRVKRVGEEPILMTMKQYQDSIDPKNTQPFKIKGQKRQKLPPIDTTTPKTRERKKSELIGIKNMGSTSNIPIKSLKTKSTAKVETITTPKPGFIEGELKFTDLTDDFEEEEEEEDPFNLPSPKSTVVIIPNTTREDIANRILKLKQDNEKEKQIYTNQKKAYDTQVEEHNKKFKIVEGINKQDYISKSDKRRRTILNKQLADFEKVTSEVLPAMAILYDSVRAREKEIEELEKTYEGEGYCGRGYIRSVQELQRRKKLYKRKV